MNSDVSRETPPTPIAAAGVFSSALPEAERYVAWLADAGVTRGLIGPRETPRLWERHVLNSGVVAQLLRPGTTIADVGSGAGLPGIPLALATPECTFVLVEPLLRRSQFLQEVVEDLGLANVEVIRARAEDLHGSREFDVVTSRAVAPLPRLLTWCMPIVRHHGRLLALKGDSVRGELDEASVELRRLGAVSPEIHSLGSEILPAPTTVLELQAAKPSRLRLATQSGTRKKR